MPALSWIYLPNLFIILKNGVSPSRVVRPPTSSHLGLFHCGGSWPLPRQTDQSLLRWISRKCILSTLSWWFKCTLNCERYCQEDKKDATQTQRAKGEINFLLFPESPALGSLFNWVLQTEFVELLTLTRGFYSRSFNDLFLVPVLRTNYTETQTDGFQLSVF